MAQRKAPRVRQEDIQSATDALRAVIGTADLTDVEKFLVDNLSEDYGRWDAMSKAAWRSIEEYGLTKRQESGAKGNVHRRMTKSEDIDIFKAASSAKISLAAKISKFINKTTVPTDEAVDEFDSFE